MASRTCRQDETLGSPTPSALSGPWCPDLSSSRGQAQGPASGALPGQAVPMLQRGEEQEGLAEGEPLRDPRPDVSHLLHTDDL